MALTKVPSNLDATVSTTQSASDNSTNVATTAYVTTAIANLSDSAPAALNTLNEIAAALGDDANYASTTTAAIAAKLPLAGGTMTGLLTVGAKLKLTDLGNTTVAALQLTDSGLGISSPTTDQMNFITADTTRMVIDASGHVGIGMTAAPIGSDTVLALYNSATPRIKLHNSTTGTASGDGAEINMSGNIMILENRENAEMRFYTNGAERLQISNNGNLEFKSTTSSFTGASSFTNHTNGYLYLRGGTSGLRLDDDSSVNTIQIVDGSSGYIKFETGDGSERMRIHANGKAAWSANGIGSTGTVARDFAFYTEGSTNGLEVRSNDQRLLFFGAAGSSGTGSDDGYLAMSSQGTGKIALNANGVSYINGGNVGIGHSNPTQRLHVAGAKTYISNIVQGQLQVEDTTSAASGVGGGILFTGSYSGTTTTAAASIEAYKSNGSGGNYAFDMVFKTRDNGAGAVERARFGADGGDPSYGRLRLTSSWGAFEIGAANNAYFHFQRNTGPSTFYFSNACQASGGFSTYSDERLKENIVTLTGALDSVAKMNGVTFKWKDATNRGSGDTGKQFGVLAQNMLEVDSELPTLNADPLEAQNNIDDDSKDTDYYSMDYSRITPFLIEAIKELKTKLEAAEARIATLEG